MAIPAIGPITAPAIQALDDPEDFGSGSPVCSADACDPEVEVEAEGVEVVWAGPAVTPDDGEGGELVDVGEDPGLVVSMKSDSAVGRPVCVHRKMLQLLVAEGYGNTVLVKHTGAPVPLDYFQIKIC